MLNMDTGCMVDTVFLCGAGYNATLSYIENKPGLDKIKWFITQYISEEFDKEEVVSGFKDYYNI